MMHGQKNIKSMYICLLLGDLWACLHVKKPKLLYVSTDLIVKK